MGHSSLVTGQDMSDLIQENIEFCQTVGTWSLANQERHDLAHDKARMAHERSPKISVSEFSDDSITFQDFMIFIVAKEKFVQCPLCNAFLHSDQLLILFS